MAAIDWSRPIETVFGSPATLKGGDEGHREVIVDTIDDDPILNASWLYGENGTVANDFLPDLRNVAEPDNG